MPERPSYGELADTLWNLRKATGMSAENVARQAGRSQAWLARFERGRAVPTPDEAALLAQLYQAPGVTRRRLVELARDLRDDQNPSARIVIRRSPAGMQQRVGRIEASSRRVVSFSPLLVPGLLQTAEYAAAVFGSAGVEMTPDQIEAAVAARMQRQELLDEPGREFVLLLPEGVLRWPLGGPAVMAPQLDRIVSAVGVPGVRVGVIPSSGSVDVAPLHSFDLYDERAVIVGTRTATAFLTQPHDVAEYVTLFDALMRCAVFGDDARTVVARVADEYRARLA